MSEVRLRDRRVFNEGLELSPEPIQALVGGLRAPSLSISRNITD
ncbi:MAG: hypothetical protein AAFY20_26990 [Cyanobacteria bacterium J06639_14]